MKQKERVSLLEFLMGVHVYLVAQLYPAVCSPLVVAHQAPLSMGFSRQEYWSGLPCLPPGDLPGPGIEPASPFIGRRILSLLSHRGSPLMGVRVWKRITMFRWLTHIFVGIYFDVASSFTALLLLKYSLQITFQFVCLNFFFTWWL